MNIGFDGKRAFHNFRGLGNYSRNLISGLHQRYPDSQYIAFTPDLTDSRATNWHKENNYLKLVTPEKFLLKKIPALWRSRFMLKAIEANQIEIYHGLHHELPIGIEKSKIKSVVTVHDVLFLRFPQFHNKLNRLIYKKKLDHACASADVVIAISEQTKRDLIEYLNVPEEKIQVVYQSCDSRFFEKQSTDDLALFKAKYAIPENYFLYVGALTASKNLMRLLEAFKQVHSQRDSFHLVLAGVGGLEPELKRQAREWNLSNVVHFPGFIDNQDLPRLYAASDCFVFPSLFEGFGIPIIEALASKTPVITSTDSCFAEAGGPGSQYVNPNDVSQLSAQMLEVVEDSQCRNSMVESGIEHVQQFRPEACAEKVMEVYHRLVGR